MCHPERSEGSSVNTLDSSVVLSASQRLVSLRLKRMMRIEGLPQNDINIFWDSPEIIIVF